MACRVNRYPCAVIDTLALSCKVKSKGRDSAAGPSCVNSAWCRAILVYQAHRPAAICRVGRASPRRNQDDGESVSGFEIKEIVTAYCEASLEEPHKQ